MRDPKTITLSEAILAYKEACEKGDQRTKAMMEAAAQGDTAQLIALAKHLETQAKRKK